MVGDEAPAPLEPPDGFTLLVGGARSGKSDLAQRLLLNVDAPVSVVVTAEARDDEMGRRIERHREDRPAEWATVEAPWQLAEAIGEIPDDHAVLLDCVSFWVANLIMHGDLEEIRSVSDPIGVAAQLVIERLADRTPPVVVVSNEVGHGLVPPDAVSREFRDVHGRVNRSLADAADRSFLVVAGRLLRLAEPVDVFG